MFVTERQDSRSFFVDVWNKHKHGAILEPLERVVETVILQHPEYHKLLTLDGVLEREFMPESGQSNPFLHMGMHIAIQEQLSIDRPSGIVAAYGELIGKIGDAHTLEHRIMECLGESLWAAQRVGELPNEQSYLECVRRLKP